MRWFVTVFCLFLLGCAPQEPPQVEAPPLPEGLEAQFVSAVAAGNDAFALQLVAETPNLALQTTRHLLDALQTLANRYNLTHAPKLALAESMLDALPDGLALSPEQWDEGKRAIALAETTLTAYRQGPLTNRPDRRLKAADRLAEQLQGHQLSLAEQAGKAIVLLPLSELPRFFARFPIVLNEPELLAEVTPNLLGKLNTASGAELDALQAMSLPTELAQGIAQQKVRLLERRHEVSATTPEGALKLGTMLRDTLHDQADAIPYTIGIGDLTNAMLRKSGGVHFSAGIEIDLPVTVTEYEAKADLVNWPEQGPDLLILVDIQLAKTQRKIRNLRKIRSQYIAAHEHLPNKAWDIAMAEWEQASQNLRSWQGNIAQMASGGLLGNALALAEMASGEEALQIEVNQKREALNAIPRTILQPIWASYYYSLAYLEGQKTLTATFHMLDRQKNRYYKNTVDINESNVFRLMVNVHPADPAPQGLQAGTITDKALKSWEKRELSLPLSKLLQDFVAHAHADAEQIEDIEPVLATLMKDRGDLPERLRQFSPYRLAEQDPRFGSVVAIRPAPENIGSGFYVAPDIVMTNFHVMEDHNIAELEHLDGTSVFGRVIAKDAVRDLALIRTPHRRVPLDFHRDATLPIGAFVEALGAPQFKEFTLSRGVISSVRKGQTANVLSGLDYNQVMLVQTDTAMNPGNSGGPLMLGDHVIGVISFKRSDSEGIGYAIHYNEAVAFLDEELPGWSEGFTGNGD